jgi:hypothetical protein
MDDEPASPPLPLVAIGERERLLPQHPVRLELIDDVERSRLTVFFRILLAIPHIIWLALWGVLMLSAVIATWLIALVAGRAPSALHRFIGDWVRYGIHVGAFLFVVGGPFPGFVGAAGRYPVDLAIGPPKPQHRLVTLFRGFLVVPALVLSAGLAVLLALVGLLGWWAALVTGRMPGGMRDLGALSLRYIGQVCAYLFLLTDRYPDASPVGHDRPLPAHRELVSPDAPAGIEPA